MAKKKGTIKWSFNTTPIPNVTAAGIQSSVTLTADGRALVAGQSSTKRSEAPKSNGPSAARVNPCPVMRVW